MNSSHFNCVVIGGGPGGYVAAIRAANRGAKVALIEAKEVGGTCLNRGCIPSKALIANAEVLQKLRKADQYGIHVDTISFDYKKMKLRKDEVVAKIRASLEKLIAANKITIFAGFGKFLSPYEILITRQEEAVLTFDTAIIATGSEPRELSAFPFDGRLIHDSTSLLDIEELPSSIAIIGGGVIGCEFACLHHEFGVDVTIIELLPTIISTEGRNVSDALTASFKDQGIKIETGTVVVDIERKSTGISIVCANCKRFDVSMCLIAVGRTFNSHGIGLDRAGVIVAEDGTIPINDQMQTNVPHIYAIGDVTGKWILAHVASHQGMVAADHATGHSAVMMYHAIPSVIFTHPEIGTIGLTLERAINEGYDATISKFPFQALGKSHAAIETEGFAQIVVEKTTGQILGAQVVGSGAATLIAEMAVAIANELTIHSISETIHAHPTITEAWMEAAFLASGMPIHLPPTRRSH
ncbi:MAG: dihydrolipoyl dehydrogenase [Chlamydiia bacterium]|nr:dihydrolipoyl dehydrogenase [Chlamydiia bacterium]